MESFPQPTTFSCFLCCITFWPFQSKRAVFLPTILLKFLWVSYVSYWGSLDKNHTQKCLQDNPSSVSGFFWSWGTVSLIVREALLLKGENLRHAHKILREPFGWTALWGSTLDLSEILKDLSHILSVICRPSFLDHALDLIFAYKSFVNFSIICHLERLGIFKTANPGSFMLNSFPLSHSSHFTISSRSSQATPSTLCLTVSH